MPRAKTPEERAAKLAAAHAAQGHRQIQPGERLALQHGAYSPAVTGPRTEERVARWIADPDFPEYAKAPAQRPQLVSLARTEVQLELLYAYTDGMTAEQIISEVDTTRERVTGGGPQGAPMHRRSRTKKRGMPTESIRRFEMLALNIRKELGLTPMAQTRMGRDVAAAKVDMAKLIADAAEDAGLVDEGEQP